MMTPAQGAGRRCPMRRSLPLLFVTAVVLVTALVGAASAAARAAEGWQRVTVSGATISVSYTHLTLPTNREV